MGASVTLTSHCILQWHLATKFSLTEALKSPPSAGTPTHTNSCEKQRLLNHTFLFFFFSFFWGRCFSFGKASRWTCNHYSETLLWFYRIRVSQPEAVSLLNHVGKAILAKYFMMLQHKWHETFWQKRSNTHIYKGFVSFAFYSYWIICCLMLKLDGLCNADDFTLLSSRRS